MVAAACSYPNRDDHGDDDQNDLDDQNGRDIGKWGCLGGLLWCSAEVKGQFYLVHLPHLSPSLSSPSSPSQLTAI